MTDDPFDPTTWQPGDRVRHPRGSVHVLGERFPNGWYFRDEIADSDQIITPRLYDFAARSWGWERVDE